MNKYNYKQALMQMKLIGANKINFVNGNINNIGYKNVYKGWVAAISCDIRNYKELCIRTKVNNLLKIIQIYSTNIITIGNLSSNYIFSSLNGDEVILVFKSESKNDNDEILEVAIWINTFKDMFVNYVKKNWNIKINFGIGISLKNNQIIAKYGKKYNDHDNELTVIGSVINEAVHVGEI